MLEQARRANQTVTADWSPITPFPILGIEIKEINNVVIRSGVLTECFQPEWFGGTFETAHVVYMNLLPGGISSWHCHRRQSDIIVAVRGQPLLRHAVVEFLACGTLRTLPLSQFFGKSSA